MRHEVIVPGKSLGLQDFDDFEQEAESDSNITADFERWKARRWQRERKRRLKMSDTPLVPLVRPNTFIENAQRMAGLLSVVLAFFVSRHSITEAQAGAIHTFWTDYGQYVVGACALIAAFCKSAWNLGRKYIHVPTEPIKKSDVPK